MDDIKDLHRRAGAACTARVHAVSEGQLRSPTPNPGWNVRALLQHLVAENCWAPPLLNGRTLDEVGDAFDGDLLGDDPVGRWDDSLAQCCAAVDACDLAAPVQLSFGVVPAEEYVGQLFADLVVHSWDLATSIGYGSDLDDDLVSACAEWFRSREAMYRDAGAIGPRPTASDDSDAQTKLLAAFGRDASPSSTFAVVTRFNAAFARRDVDEIMSLMTDDCVFEDTTPPDGRRHVGQSEVRAAWMSFFASAPDAVFETEDGIIAGDRASYRWCYRFTGGHVRGVDVFTTRAGKVSEKLSYVKG